MCVTNSMIPSWHFVLSQSQLISINHAFSASAFSFLFAFIVNQKPSFYSYLFVDRYIGLRKPMRWSVTFNPQLGIPALGLLVSTASMNVDLHVARPRSATNRWVAIFLGYRKFVFCFSLFFSPFINFSHVWFSGFYFLLLPSIILVDICLSIYFSGSSGFCLRIWSGQLC